MTRRLRLAALASILALLLSAAVVPFVREWHYIDRTAWIDDPDHPGRVKLIAVMFPIYWFYIAAALCSFLGSFIVLRSGEGLRARSLLLFLLLTDLLYVWIGGIGYHVSLHLLAPDWDKLHYTETLEHLGTFNSVLNWVELPVMGLLIGILGGNFATRGFGFLVGLPTILWLGLCRLSTNNLRSRDAENGY